MHASHSESSKKIYHRLYKLSADKISAKQFIRYSSGKPLYRISRNQFIGRNKTGATTHGAGFTNIEAGFMKQVLYLPVVCGEINLSSRLTVVLHISTISSFTLFESFPVSRAKVWNIFIMPSQCRDSSRTDHETICPMPFILLKRGKFINIANDAKS